MKTIKTFIVASILALTFNVANAGVGLSATALLNIAQGKFVAAAISGGLGVSSMIYGQSAANSGFVIWGTFFFILEEEGLISARDHELLVNADEATQAAFVEISLSDELSEEEKREALSELSL